MMLTLLYTHALRGDLDQMPRLHTLLRRRRDAAAGRVLLVDLGASCVPEVWPCGITEGRAMLLALDAMGFTAAYVGGVLTPETREKLAEQVALALVDAAHPFILDRAVPSVLDTLHFVADTPAAPPVLANRLTISLLPAAATTLHQGVLCLAAPPTGLVGQVTLDIASAQLRQTFHALPPDTPPDTTIAGVLAYIRAEARLYERRQHNG